MVEDLEPSRPFTVRVQCIISKRCSQCVMSDTFTVPPGQSALYEKEALKKKEKSEGELPFESHFMQISHFQS